MNIQCMRIKFDDQPNEVTEQSSSELSVCKFVTFHGVCAVCILYTFRQALITDEKLK